MRSDDASSEHGEGALRHGFANGRRYDRPDRFLYLLIAASGNFVRAAATSPRERVPEH